MEALEILWKDILNIPTEPTKIDETLLKDLIAISRERFNSGKVLCILDPCDLASV
jgi:hypothetical protein